MYTQLQTVRSYANIGCSMLKLFLKGWYSADGDWRES